MCLRAQSLPERDTLRSGICYRISVCLSSVTFVRTTQPAEIFGNISTPFLYLSHLLTSMQDFTEIVPGESIRWGLNVRRVAKYSDFGPVECDILETVSVQLITNRKLYP